MEALLAEAAAIGLTLPDAGLPYLNRYRSLLLAWNRRVNLTAIRDPEAVRHRHFLDSLSCLLVTGPLDGQHLADVGTGGGFPGLVLKIVYPDLRLTLIESVQKKCRFLTAVVTELGLRDVQVVAERAELVGQMERHREQYDWVTARAVAPLPVLWEYLLPLCRVGGTAIAMKGAQAKAEAIEADAASQLLGGAPAQLTPVPWPEPSPPTYLVTVAKTGPTPTTYPRRPGRARKRPLAAA